MARANRPSRRRTAATSERHRFLADLAEELSRLNDSERLLETVTRAVGEHLGLSRCLFNEVDLPGDRMTIHRDYHRDLPSVAGTYPLAAFSPVTVSALKAGRTVVVESTRADPRTADRYATGYAPYGIEAFVAVPLLREGLWASTLSSTAAAPRRWEDSENALLRTVAERAWLAVENARLLRQTAALLAREQIARAEAEAANRTKDEFLATLSHELRTPLTSILGWSRLLRGGHLDAEAVARAHEVIERNARMQAQLIEDLLDVSRIITGKLQLRVREVALPGVIEAALEIVRPAAGAKVIKVTADLDPAAPPVLADPGRLQQVVWNLLANAVKFTAAGGHIEVRLDERDGAACLQVVDSGIGIAPAFLPHIFDRFSQADSSIRRTHGGLGLGLALVRHVVEMHGGHVRAESAGPGHGATFTVTLPPAPSAAVARGARAGGGAPGTGGAPRRGVRVLLVEDEPDTSEMVTTVLERCGARVRLAASAADATLALGPDRFDVLLVDIGLPGEDGYGLIRRVRSGQAGAPHQATPAIALTAYARPQDRDEALRSGFDMHLTKPLDPAVLTHAVAAVAST